MTLDRVSIGLPGATPHGVIAVGALGPKMRDLAARLSDAVILNWLTPEAAADQRSSVRTVLYARTALTPDALPALREEATRYASYPAYAADFERIGATALETTIQDAGRIDDYVAVVDELVLRVITPEPTLAEYERFLTTLS